MTTISVSSRTVIEAKREDTTCPTCTSAGKLTNAVEESGEDHSGTVTVVTPKRIHVYQLPNKFPTAVQEMDFYASAELVC